MVRLWKEMVQGKCGLGLGKKEGGQGKGREGEGEGRPARPCDPTPELMSSPTLSSFEVAADLQP